MMALKLRLNLVNCFTMPGGATAIAANSLCKISSSVLVVATASTEASAVFVYAEDVASTANREIQIAGVGSIALCNAHDGNITEGEWVVAAAAGRAVPDRPSRHRNRPKQRSKRLAVTDCSPPNAHFIGTAPFRAGIIK